MEREPAVIRFLLRSPLLWIGIFVTIYLSWLWIESGGVHLGFNYSRNGHLIAVTAGAERLGVAWISQPGLNYGYMPLGPGGIWVRPSGKDAPVWFTVSPRASSRHWQARIHFRTLLTTYLVVWYGFLGWRVWRYHRKHVVAVDMPAGTGVRS